MKTITLHHISFNRIATTRCNIQLNTLQVSLDSYKSMNCAVLLECIN